MKQLQICYQGILQQSTKHRTEFSEVFGIFPVLGYVRDMTHPLNRLCTYS